MKMNLEYVIGVKKESIKKEVGNIIQFFKNLVFLIAYIYFFINDIKNEMVNIEVFIIYAFIGVGFIILDIDNINALYLVNIVYSVCFGVMILLFSYISREAIGIGDSLFFIANGLYMCLNDNVMLFLTGLIVASLYGFYKYVKCRFIAFDIGALRVPFMPCLLPMVIWRVICLL